MLSTQLVEEDIDVITTQLLTSLHVSDVIARTLLTYVLHAPLRVVLAASRWTASFLSANQSGAVLI